MSGTSVAGGEDMLGYTFVMSTEKMSFSGRPLSIIRFDSLTPPPPHPILEFHFPEMREEKELLQSFLWMLSVFEKEEMKFSERDPDQVRETLK